MTAPALGGVGHGKARGRQAARRRPGADARGARGLRDDAQVRGTRTEEGLR